MIHVPNPLIGKRVVSVHLASDKKAIRFIVDGGDPIVARVDGDCCSSSWIESLDAPAALLGVVTSVEDLDMPDLGNGQAQTEDKERDADCIAYYGCKITTERGACVIDFRNESNGYYGGSLVWTDADFYGGVHGQNVSNDDWREVAL